MAMGFGTLVYQNANQVQIAGGTIDNTVIGFAHPAAAKFTDAIIEHAPYQQYHVTNKKYVDGKFDMLVDMINVASGNRYVAMVVDGTPVPAISGFDAFSFVAGANIVLTPQVGTRTMTIAASIPPPSNDYSILDVDGTPVPALSVGDTFSLVAGTNITLTPNVGGRSVTIDASGGGGGGNVVTNSQLVNASGAWAAEWADSEEVAASSLWTGNTSLIFGRDNGGNPDVSPLRDTDGIIELQWGAYDATHTVRSPLGTILGSSSCYIGDGTGSVLSQEYNMILASSDSGISRNCTYCSIVNGDTVSLLNADGAMKGHVFIASAETSEIANLNRGFFGSIRDVIVGTTTTNCESIFVGCAFGVSIGDTGGDCTNIALVVGNSNTITDASNVGILFGNYNTITTSAGVGILAGESNTVADNNRSAIVAGWDNTFEIQRSVLVNAQYSDFDIDPTNPDIIRTTVLMGIHNRQRVSNSVQIGSDFAEGINADHPFKTAQAITFVAGAITDSSSAVLNSRGPDYDGVQEGVYCFPEENGTAGFEVLVTASDVENGYFEVWKIVGILYKDGSNQFVSATIDGQGANPRGDWSITVLDPNLALFFGIHVEVASSSYGRTIWTAHFKVIENTCNIPIGW
jgi:hypothetical protein